MLEWGSEPDGLWHDLIADALDRNDLRRAREISKRLQDAATLLHMRADRRFDALVKAEPRTFDLRAAMERECKRLAKAVAANPRSLSVRVQYGYALLAAGRFTELLDLADEIIARTTAAPPDGSPLRRHRRPAQLDLQPQGGLAACAGPLGRSARRHGGRAPHAEEGGRST